VCAHSIDPVALLSLRVLCTVHHQSVAVQRTPGSLVEACFPKCWRTRTLFPSSRSEGILSAKTRLSTAVQLSLSRLAALRTAVPLAADSGFLLNLPGV